MHGLFAHRRPVAGEMAGFRLASPLFPPPSEAHGANGLFRRPAARSLAAASRLELVAPFAAGWLSLQEPRKALPWLRRIEKFVKPP